MALVDFGSVLEFGLEKELCTYVHIMCVLNAMRGGRHPPVVFLSSRKPTVFPSERFDWPILER